MSVKHSELQSAIPENIAEEYYQINQEILASFPKYRPLVDLFQFREDIAQLFPFSRKGTRLSNEQVEEVATLCEEGILFVSRSDLSIYSKHIVKQIDLVLLDVNFKPAEVAELVRAALKMRLQAFLEQPVLLLFGLLQRDLLVFTEILWKDKHYIKIFMRRLHTGTYDLAEHMLNTLMVGLWFVTYVTIKEEIKRKQLDHLAVAFLLMNLGMSKIPVFILAKTQPLSVDEREKIEQHPVNTLRILHKLDVVSDELKSATMEHHERLDGSGYPQKLNTLSETGRVAALAEAFSAMITEHSYAKAKPVMTAAKELADDKRFDKQKAMALVTAYVTGTLSTQDPVKRV